MTVHRSRELPRAVLGGAISGIVGGICLGLFLIAASRAQGLDGWIALKAAAFPLVGAAAFDPGFRAFPVALGVASHFVLAATWGVIFGVLAYGLSRSTTVLAGLSFGVVVWLATFFLLLPLLGAGHLVEGTPAVVALFQHVVLFGLPTSLAFLPFQRERVALTIGPEHPLAHRLVHRGA